MKAIIYDSTASWFLVLVWRAWARVLLLTRRVDEVYPAVGWNDALQWLGSHATRDQPWTMVQFWCHGRPGQVLLGDTTLGRQATAQTWVLLGAFSDVLHRDGWVWFRSCSTFAGDEGKAFAEFVGRTLNCQVAGFTHIIGPFQSGLQLVPKIHGVVGVTQTADWPSEEGGAGVRSWPWLPHTISCLRWWL